MRENPQQAEAETVAFIRRGYELWNDEDVEGLARQILSDDVFWLNPPDRPGQSTYRGRDAVTRFLRDEVAAVIELSDIEIEGIEAFGNEYVIHMLARARAQDSHLDIGKVPVFHVARVRGGRVAGSALTSTNDRRVRRRATSPAEAGAPIRSAA